MKGSVSAEYASEKAFVAEELIKNMSRATIDKLTHFVGNDTERFAIIVALMRDEAIKLQERSAWVMSNCIEYAPFLIEPFWEEIFDILLASSNPSVLRNIVRAWQFCSIPETMEGRVVDYCIASVSNPQAPIAQRAYAITVLENLLPKYPELGQEIAAIINELMEFSPPAIKARAKNFLKQYHKKRKPKK